MGRDHAHDFHKMEIQIPFYGKIARAQAARGRIPVAGRMPV